MKQIPHQSSNIISVFKIGSIIFIILVGFSLIVLIIIGLNKTYRSEHSNNQQKFLRGKVPNPLPDGFYKGNTFTGLGANWQGKVFNREKQTGINRFGDGDRFVFKTYEAVGLRDKNTKMLRIDYNQTGNPWWLHFVVDEIVEIEPGHYLGKVHLKIIPGLPFTLTYFELSNQ